MEKFKTFTGTICAIDRANIDTDALIPKEHLKSIKRTGFGSALFSDWRYNEDGSEKPDFVLNKDQYRDGKIIVADENWGCGSSREGAVYALMANNIRCVIAPSFGDIHYNNGMKNGMLPVQLSRGDCDTLRAQLNAEPGVMVTVDLDAQSVTGPDGATYSFDIEPFSKHCMLNGLDDISVTWGYDDQITAFEEKRRQEADWLY